MKKSVILATAAAMLISSSAFGVVIKQGESKTCNTTYKNGANPCVGIAGAGTATGCISAGTPTTTNNAGKSSVTITWNSPGSGKYSWNNVGNCVPNPLYCNYTCSKATVVDIDPGDDDPDIRPVDGLATGGFDAHLQSLYAAVTDGQVMEALERIGTVLYAQPLGRNFDEALRERALQELESLVGRSHVEAVATPYLLSIDQALDADMVRREARPTE